MTDKFKVGQRVRIIKGRYAGLEAIILEQRKNGNLHRPSGRIEYSTLVYPLDIQNIGIYGPSGKRWASKEHWLAPIYDGNEKTTWDDCYKVTGWKPKEVVKLD